jgi:hypothetical protein
MEKAIIVVLDVAKAVKKKEEAQSDALEELNKHLAEGWSVKQSFAMGGTGHDLISASLVILQKTDG